MFERFTDRARRVVVLAQEEARCLNHNYIGTEHILLGLIHEGEGVAATTLTGLGIALEEVRQRVEEIIGKGERPPSAHIPFTPRAKRVMELSLKEALKLGHNYIGTEHLLLALLREGEGVAAQVLVKLGIEDLEALREATAQVLGEATRAALARTPLASEARSDTDATQKGKDENHARALEEIATKIRKYGVVNGVLASQVDPDNPHRVTHMLMVTIDSGES